MTLFCWPHFFNHYQNHPNHKGKQHETTNQSPSLTEAVNIMTGAFWGRSKFGLGVFCGYPFFLPGEPQEKKRPCCGSAKKTTRLSTKFGWLPLAFEPLPLWLRRLPMTGCGVCRNHIPTEHLWEARFWEPEENLWCNWTPSWLKQVMQKIGITTTNLGRAVSDLLLKA